MYTFTKDPDATLDYVINWTLWLSEINDAIATSTWIIEDGITNEADEHNAQTCTIWLSGGTVGSIYKITNRITTSYGRIDDRSFLVKIAEK